MKIGLILLAAGGSTRLGSPKQLLQYHGTSLLRHAAGVALASACRPVVVVLGSGAGRLRDELRGLDILAVENADWSRGMGSSIRAGMQTLGSHALDAVALTLCDQPLVTPRSLDALAAAFGRSGGIVASAYEGSVGVPAVLGCRYFDELLALPDGAGAKHILLAHRAALTELALPEGAVDIDTPEQYARLM